MECSDEIHDDKPDVSAADEPPPTTPKHKRKPPKRRKKFGRANYGDNNKKRRTGADAAIATATDDNDLERTAAVATPSTAIRSQERQAYQSQQIQSFTKKSEGLFDECANLKKQLADSETENDKHQQERQQPRQQLRDGKSAHEKEVQKLRAAHKEESSKQNKLYLSQQKRYKTFQELPN